MFTAALACVLATQTQTVTLRANFLPVETVIQQIAAQTGQPMLATGELKNFPLYINVKNVPLNDLLTRIGKTVGGEWSKRDGNLYLSLESDVRTRQDREGDPEIVKALEATINTPIKPPMTEDDFKKVERSAEKDQKVAMEMVGKIFANMYNPDEASMKLIQAIGAKDLSTIIEGRRVVLSSNPNQMQGLLNANSVNLIMAEMRKLAAKAPKSDTKAEDPMAMFGAMFGGGLSKPELVNKVSLIQAAFQIQKRNTLNVTINAYTPDGAAIYTKQVSLPMVNPEASRPLVTTGTPISLSAATQEYVKALGENSTLDPFTSMIVNFNGNISSVMGMVLGGAEGMGQPVAPITKPISPGLRAKLLDPVTNEPFAMTLGEVLDSQAAKGQNVIASPSDDILGSLVTAINGKNPTVEGVLDAIDRAITQEVDTDGTWTIIRASSPLELRSAFCNRTALKNLITGAGTRGYINLEDCLKFASQQTLARGSETLAIPYTQALFRTSDMGAATALTGLGFDALKFYGTFDQTQRATLEAGKPIALASLFPGQREILGRMVYNGMVPPMGADNPLAGMMEGASTSTTSPDGQVTIKTDSVGGDDDDSGMGAMAGMGMAMAAPMMSMFGMGGVTVMNERTNLLPVGIPSFGTMKLKRFNMKSLMAMNTDTGVNTIGVPEMMAMFEGDNPQAPVFSGMKRSYNMYKLAQQSTLMFTFDFAKKASYFTSLYDVTVDNSRTYRKDELPKKMQERLAPPNFGAPASPPPVPPLL
ncbi:MAG: hypothetical protein WCK51_09895 [Armatimonadota bacterium]